MRVARAEVLHLRAPLATPAGPAGVYNRYRETLLLRLESTDGVVGWGETYAVGGTRETLTTLAAQLVGAALTRRPPRPAGLDEVSASFALGAVDIAWHDLLGRSLGVPVHTLLGGARRARIRAYASGFLYRQGEDPDHTWPTEAATALARGFRCLKLRVGGQPPAVELDRVARLRAQLPPEVDFMVDAWGSYAPATALRVGRRLGELGALWFEEPTHVAAPDLTARLDVPVAGGEMGRTLAELRGMLERREVDVIQPDASICGGLGTVRAVGELAASYGIACVPHTWNGAVMAAATLHVAATLPPLARTGDADPGPLLEYDTSENPFMTATVHEPLSVVDGWVSVPDSPGLGVEVDEDALAQFRIG